MTTIEKHEILKRKILLGLEKAYQKLVAEKKAKGGELVILKDGKIVKIKP